MRRARGVMRLLSVLAAVVYVDTALVNRASADTPAPAPAPAPAASASTAAPPPATPPMATEPMPAPVPPPGTPPAQAATPPLATEAMPATREEKLPAIDVGAWVRAAGRLQKGSDAPQSLAGLQMDTAYVELHAGGKIHKNVSVTLNLNANGLGGTAGIEDAIIGFDFADPIHLWLGQLLVPVDRANFSGPFFMIPWNYPGVFGPAGVVAIPKEGPAGRNIGGAIWGNDPDGKIKYAVGLFLPPAGSPSTATPLLSAHVSTALIGKETGYFGNETFFGNQDIVSIGVGAQYQKNGSVGPAPVAPAMGAAPTDNYGEFTADALGEFKYGDGGWFSLDGAFYHFAGQYQAATDGFYVTAAIASPKVGVGNIQPMIRYQQGMGRTPAGGSGALNEYTVDASLNYLIMGPALRAMVNFEHAGVKNETAAGTLMEANMVQFGAQAIFF